MKIIEKTEPFGDTFISWQTYINDGTGLTVKCPHDGEFIVREDNTGKVCSMYEYSDGIIASPKKLFQKTGNGKYTVFFCAKKGISVKGFCIAEGLDVDYGSVPADFRVPYEVTLKIAEGREKELVENFLNTRILSPVKCGVLKEMFVPFFNTVIKGVFGKRLLTQTVEVINRNHGEVSDEVLQEMNKPSGRICDYGFSAVSFSFSLSEEYLHRQEKKRTASDEYIQKRRGKKI